jgi:hypothetical protein
VILLQKRLLINEAGGWGLRVFVVDLYYFGRRLVYKGRVCLMVVRIFDELRLLNVTRVRIGVVVVMMMEMILIEMIRMLV